MTNGIFINRIDFRINETEFSKQYTIIRAEFEDYSKRKEAVEKLTKYQFVCALKYDFKPGLFYALCLNDSKIKDALDFINKITLDSDVAKTVPISSLDRDIQLELLNIGLGRFAPDEFGHYSNMEGALFVFDAPYFKKDHVEALNIKYRKPKELMLFGDVAIEFRAMSFYDWGLRNKMRFKKKRPDDYIKYAATDDGTMKMLVGQPKKDQMAFIQHGYGKRKASIPFYDVGSVAKLDSSKMGLLFSSHRDIRRVYGPIFDTFGFVRTNAFDHIHISKKSGHDSRFEEYLKKKVYGREFRIYDYLNTYESKTIISGFISDVDKICGITVTQEPQLDTDVLNIAVVQKSFGDENHGFYLDKVVQHLAVDSLLEEYQKENLDILSKEGKSRRTKVMMILLNAIIKDDVQRKEQTFYQWVRDELVKAPDDRDWYFTDRVRIVNPDPDRKMEATFSSKMAVMKLSSDGSTDYQLYERNELPDEWMKIAYAMFKQGDANICGIVSDGTSIYKFCDTDLVMIPEVEKTRNVLYNNPEYYNKKGKMIKSSEGVRDGDNREEQLKACTDIRGGYTDDGDMLYFVGSRGDGMNTGIQWAANLHCAKIVDGIEPLPEYLLELMLAPFVRYLGMTVIPYPFKYLHEFEHMHGLEDHFPETDNDEGGGERIKQMTIFDFPDTE